jgi:CRISPR-associated endonuclease/helicase Cas3
VPTGLGKSALIDAAIWAAAHGGWRRIVFVVDRRIVVDAVCQRAERVKKLLDSTQDRALRQLAQSIGETQIVRLRGGVFGDDEWVLYPDRLSVVLSTVDQIGSRLLFRGYGVSPRRWPLHAAFLGSDTLIVVDEAHLSTPFLQTLESIRQAGADITVVPMSATLPGPGQEASVGLEPDDLKVDTVRRRLCAHKPARLLEANGNEDDFIQALTEQVHAVAAVAGIARVAVVVNRVATARRCFDRLTRAGRRCVLLTGRVRPLDRDRSLEQLLSEVQAGRRRQPDDAPFVVVATQTIEVGADFDFDALVTECAPLSALRQRFGRVDRMGQRGESPGVVLRRDKDDAVYGEATAAAWAWLCERAGGVGQTVDFGLEVMGELLATHPAPQERSAHAATLLPAHLGLLAQTGVFAPELDISAWLHGPTDKAAEVTLVWRDDLLADAPHDWPRSVSLLPPLLREGLAMPAAAVRRWLTGEKPGEQWSDLEADVDDEKTGPAPERPVLRWRGAEDCSTIPARDIRPGDTLVLPASYGGCDCWGWAPPRDGTSVRSR